MSADLTPDVRDRAAEAARKVDRDYGHWQDWVGSIDEFEHERALSTVDAVVAVVAEEIERPLQARIEELEAALRSSRDKADRMIAGSDRNYARIAELEQEKADALELLEDARGYITPTLSTHEQISVVLGWCDCGYCVHVPKQRPGVT